MLCEVFFPHSGIIEHSSLLGCYAGSTVPDSFKDHSALRKFGITNPNVTKSHLRIHEC
jgi:hypothetical protein